MERRNGFWWSPDSSSLAFTEVDASPVPPLRIPHYSAHLPAQPGGKGAAAAAADCEEIHQYPFAGEISKQLEW